MAERVEFGEQVRLLTSAAARYSSTNRRSLPSTAAVVGLIGRFKRLIFAGADVKQSTLRFELVQFRDALTSQIAEMMAWAGERNGRSAKQLATVCIERIPEIQGLLIADVGAAIDGDPALHSTEEAILCYPGVAAVICHRFAHLLFSLQVPILPRVISEHAHSFTGIDIHPGAVIGEGFFIDHGTGVVIGETAIVGKRVRLYQGVTLGAKSFEQDADGRIRKGGLRHPILEDEVVVYSWASILGRITVGRGSVIGGSVWVTRDVPPGTLVTQAGVRRSEFCHGAGI